MARTLTQIYTDAVKARNNYLQLTELQPTDLSTSKLSIMGILTYVVSVVIYSYETILDKFHLDVLSEVTQRMNGTPEYYLRIAKLFQFNSTTQLGDELVFNEDTLQIGYTTVSENNRIIEKAAYQYEDGKEYDITLKVCKSSGNTGEAGSYVQLTDAELTAFKNYIDKIKFVGTNINCVSTPGDILTVNAIIYYDDANVTGKQAYSQVKVALLSFIQNLDYNDYLYYQKVIDAIQAAGNISDIEADSVISLRSYSEGSTSYSTSKTVTNRERLFSGYLTLLDESNASTLTYEICKTTAEAKLSKKNLKFVPISAI